MADLENNTDSEELSLENWEEKLDILFDDFETLYRQTQLSGPDKKIQNYFAFLEQNNVISSESFLQFSEMFWMIAAERGKIFLYEEGTFCDDLATWEKFVKNSTDMVKKHVKEVMDAFGENDQERVGELRKKTQINTKITIDNISGMRKIGYAEKYGKMI